MLVTDIIVSYISQMDSVPNNIFYYFDISSDEKLSIPVSQIKQHPIYKEYQDLSKNLDLINMFHHTPYVGRTWIFFDGLLSNTPDRRYSVAITCTSEYAVHVFKKSTNEYMFCVPRKLTQVQRSPS
jgi:hypothetical protein